MTAYNEIDIAPPRVLNALISFKCYITQNSKIQHPSLCHTFCHCCSTIRIGCHILLTLWKRYVTLELLGHLDYFTTRVDFIANMNEYFHPNGMFTGLAL